MCLENMLKELCKENLLKKTDYIKSKAIEQKIIRFINEQKLIESGDKILIALSGGPDSVFLLHFLNKYKQKYEISIGAAHLNHLLRGRDSDRDEIFCEAICDELQIPIISTRKDVKKISVKNKQSIEVAARKSRYDFLSDVSEKGNYNKVATAHNLDDNTETVLLNLIKGAGIKGIAGIPVRREKIIRPLLCVSKEEILFYLEAYKFEYRIDKSNLSSEFERNFLRNEILPLISQKLNPSVNIAVLTSSLNLQSLIQVLDETKSELSTSIKSEKNNDLIIPLSIFNSYPKFLVSYTIKSIVDDNFNIKLESSDLKKIFSVINKQTGKSEELSRKLMVFKNRDSILIKRKTGYKISGLQKIKVGEKKKIGNQILYVEKAKLNNVGFSDLSNIEYIDAEKVNGAFIIRKWRDGDRFTPFGMNGTKKVSDFLNDIKVNPSEKKDQLVLENNKNIVWIIGKRIDDRYKITRQTKKVLKLCLK